MSAVAPLRRPFGLRVGAEAVPVEAPRTTPAKARPRLVIVAPPRSTAGRLPFLIVIGAVLVSGLLMLLMLHTLAAQDGFKVNALQAKLNTLTDTEQGLAQQVQQDSSPAKLRKSAAALGMVPSTIPAYKHVHGRVVGLEQPAYTPVAPTPAARVNPKTPTTSGTANGATDAKSATASTTNPTSATSTATTTSGTTAAPTTHHHKATTATTTTSTTQQPSKHHKSHPKPTTGQ